MIEGIRCRYDSLTRELYVHHYNYAALPSNLPKDMLVLKCSANALTDIPDGLPKRLQEFWCCDNKLTRIRSRALPRGLYMLKCSKNKITKIDSGLPTNLKILDCSNNELTWLPELPPKLNHLYCYNNKLTVLPDLPETMLDVQLCRAADVALHANYPKLAELQMLVNFAALTYSEIDDLDDTNNIAAERWLNKCTQELAQYVNSRNVIVRQQERTRTINANSRLLDIYMRRMMHPDRIRAALTGSEDAEEIDVDKWMTDYVEKLKKIDNLRVIFFISNLTICYIK